MTSCILDAFQTKHVRVIFDLLNDETLHFTRKTTLQTSQHLRLTLSGAVLEHSSVLLQDSPSHAVISTRSGSAVSRLAPVISYGSGVHFITVGWPMIRTSESNTFKVISGLYGLVCRS
jgi:hypothetical protein